MIEQLRADIVNYVAAATRQTLQHVRDDLIPGYLSRLSIRRAARRYRLRTVAIRAWWIRCGLEVGGRRAGARQAWGVLNLLDI